MSEPSILDTSGPTAALLNPSKYAIASVDLAKQALAQCTFAVGGVLLDKNGRVLKQMHNNVITDKDGPVSNDSSSDGDVKNKCINDPTAHGERQLISWYYDNAKNLPPASELTIVTSLDPCIMCTGSFLTSGINVAVVSLDDRAGVNWKQDRKMSAIPEAIRNNALRQFSYLGIEGTRDFSGSESSTFYGTSIASQIDEDSKAAFGKSIGIVHQILDNEDPTPVNIRDKGPEAPELPILRRYWKPAATEVTDISTLAGRKSLYALMAIVASGETLDSSASAKGSAALLDPFNNVLLIMPHGPNPVDTPFMMLTRAYASCRRAADWATNGSLPHPKRCKIVLFNGPGQTAPDVLDLGAYGSSLETKPLVPDNLNYFNPQQSPESLKQMIAALPPLYSGDIHIDPILLKL